MVYRSRTENKKSGDSASIINFVKLTAVHLRLWRLRDDDQEPSQKQAITLSKKLSEAGIKNTVFHYEKEDQ